VKGRNETYVSVRPALEAGGEIVTGDGTLVRPRARLGVTQFLSGGDPEIAARLEGAPVGVAPFVVKQDFDQTYLDVEVGVDVLTKGGATVRAGYLGQFSDHTDSHGVMLKVSLPF
jgi:outer membrane autotransporter protein